MYALKLADEVLNSHFRLNFKEWCANKRVSIPTEVCELPLSVADQILFSFSFHSFSSVLIFNFSPSFFLSLFFLYNILFFFFNFYTSMYLTFFFLSYSQMPNLSYPLSFFPFHQFRTEGSSLSPAFRSLAEFLTEVIFPLIAYIFISSNVRFSVYRTSKTEPLKCFIVWNCTNYTCHMSLLMGRQPEAKLRFM